MRVEAVGFACGAGMVRPRHAKPYDRVEELPAAVRELSPDLQALWLRVFNEMWESNLALPEAEREAVAFRTAWAVVNRQSDTVKLHEQGGEWSWFERIKAGRTWIATRSVEIALRTMQDSANPAVRTILGEFWTGLAKTLGPVAVSDLIQAGKFTGLAARLEWEKQWEIAEPKLRSVLDISAVKGNAALVPGLEKIGAQVSYEQTAKKVGEFLDARIALLKDSLVNVQADTVGKILEQTILRNPINPREGARMIREAIGLHPNQAQAVMRFRAALASQQVAQDRIERMAARYSATLLRQRAESIARTETTSAFNFSTLATTREAVQEGNLPGTVRKYWYTAEDERTCERCAEMNGQERALGEDFQDPTTGELVMAPSLHPNCRCTMRMAIA